MTDHARSHPAGSRPASPVRQRLALSALLAAIGALSVPFLLATSEKPAPRASAPRVLPVSTLLTRADSHYEVRRAFTGQVEPTRESPLGFELSGLLVEVRVDDGETVRAGDTLARLDTQRLEARRSELAAALREAEAALALARVTRDRFEDVIQAGGVTRQELDEAREGYRAAEAAVGLARSRIETVDVDISKSVLQAPFDGVVVNRSADEGRVVQAGEAVLELQELGTREVRIGVAGPLVAELATGQRRSIKVGGKTVGARVKAILPRRDVETRTVDVILALDESALHLRPGELARLELSRRVPDAGFWLPVGALAEGERGLWTVYAARPLTSGSRGDEATHRLVSHIVEVLHADSDRVYVRGNLTAGQRIVDDGLHRVVPGQLVRLGGASGVDIAGEAAVLNDGF